MANLGNILLEKDILLESGTNEVEVLVFRLGTCTFGINVAKVREVLPAQKITFLPKAHPSVIGCFTLRDSVVPCVSLQRHLNEETAIKPEEATIVLTEFNQFQTAFVVDVVERIHRISWEQVMAAPSIVTDSAAPVTAIAKIDDRLVTMLDFETIADQISDHLHRQEGVPNPHGVRRDELRILLADDSPTVRQAVETTLHESGYTNLTFFENGEQAWKWISRRFEETGKVSEVADLLVSDVEMPCMDGFHLTKNIKEHPELKQLTVLLFSSILTHENRKKGEFVKADALITKPELFRVVELADEWIMKAQARNGEGPASSHGTDLPTTTPSRVPNPETQDSTDSKLWVSFRNELSERVEQLNVMCNRDPDTESGCKELIKEILRVLHSIKSAAMVVPVDEVSRLTHVLEDLMSATQKDTNSWPRDPLERYVDWLGELAQPSHDAEELQAILAKGSQIEELVTADACG